MSNSTNSSGIIVLSGPSGSGKSTIVDLVIARSPVPVLESVSATTRPRRPREVHGQDYYFLSKEEFLSRRDAEEFLESAEVHGAGYLYGTLKSEVERIRQTGAWAFLEIDVEGASSVVTHHPDALTIFLTTPSAEEFERRLRARKTESEEDIQRRLRTADEELQHAGRYRHVVVNDKLDRAVDEICELIQHEAKTD